MNKINKIKNKKKKEKKTIMTKVMSTYCNVIK